jgi:hypothetical protein
LVPFLAGLYLAGYTFRYRNPVDMMASTAATFRGFFSRSRQFVDSRREEPFVVSGPYRFVRNPLYDYLSRKPTT